MAELRFVRSVGDKQQLGRVRLKARVRNATDPRTIGYNISVRNFSASKAASRRAFSGADETRWYSEFILDCDDDAAFAAAIELGTITPVSVNAVELACLTEGVAASSSVDDKQCLLRRIGPSLPSARFTFPARPSGLFWCVAARRIAK